MSARAPQPKSSWVPGAAGSSYDADNLPYAVFSVGDEAPRVGTRVGDHVLDLTPVLGDTTFAHPDLGVFMGRGQGAWRVARRRLVQLVTDPVHTEAVTAHLHPLDSVTLHPPFAVADYVDFYCSLQHATNVGRIFRPDGVALLPNWRHLPVGYHGRAGTVVVSGTEVRRPIGQRVPTGSTTGPPLVEPVDITPTIQTVSQTPLARQRRLP